MQCITCGAETKNPKFCSRSCSAKETNKLNPKRVRKSKKCVICDNLVYGKALYCCQECRDKSPKNQKIWSERADKAKYCTKCGVLKTKDNSLNHKYSYCKSCHVTAVGTTSYLFKKQCVDYKGGKCAKCGYDKCIAAMDFHHLDPSQKEFCVTAQKTRIVSDKIKQELDKCLLLCSNCHRETHHLEKELNIKMTLSQKK